MEQTRVAPRIPLIEWKENAIVTYLSEEAAQFHFGRARHHVQPVVDEVGRRRHRDAAQLAGLQGPKR